MELGLISHCYGARMRFGAHVRAGKGLVPALQHGADIGAEVIQIFTQSPRMWKPSQYSPEVLAAYREAQALPCRAPCQETLWPRQTTVKPSVRFPLRR